MKENPRFPRSPGQSKKEAIRSAERSYHCPALRSDEQRNEFACFPLSSNGQAIAEGGGAWCYGRAPPPGESPAKPAPGQPPKVNMGTSAPFLTATTLVQYIPVLCYAVDWESNIRSDLFRCRFVLLPSICCQALMLNSLRLHYPPFPVRVCLTAAYYTVAAGSHPAKSSSTTRANPKSDPCKALWSSIRPPLLRQVPCIQPSKRRMGKSGLCSIAEEPRARMQCCHGICCIRGAGKYGAKSPHVPNRVG